MSDMKTEPATAQLFATLQELKQRHIPPARHGRFETALAMLERRLTALENRDATTREACDLIHRAAERLRKDGAASTDELRAAEARGFERARERAAEVAHSEASECKRLKRSAEDMGATHARQSWQAAEAAAEGIERTIRAMKDETP